MDQGMTAIKFSIYGDQSSPLENPDFLLGEFHAQHHVTVQVERLAWEEAWPKLLNFALHGGGPHISQIGSIWTSTLVSMNALRPFTPQEVASLGGREAFLRPTWQSVTLPNQPGVWGVPFTAFTYIVLYRRDLLQCAGVDEGVAFASPEAMIETLRKLRAAGISAPLVLPAGEPYRARVHLAASWIWGAGGDFVGEDGHDVLIDQSEARAGLKCFFNLYHYLSPRDHHLTYDECLQSFAQGRVAVTLASSAALALIRSARVSQVLDNLGVAAMPGVPWIGGSNLVVWREAQMYPDLDRAALALAKYLTSPLAQMKYAAASNAIPARSAALSQMVVEPASLREIFAQVLSAGRSYKPVLMWVRMLNDLSRTFDAITADVLADPALDIDRALTQHLTPLAQRYDLMLSTDHLVHSD
jgi:multiple sugar transport system substrate-binding protein